jgi:hypothetical protein
MRRNNEQPFFMGMPMGMGMQFAPSEPQQRIDEIVVPPRIDKAMQFLNMLNRKTEVQVAASEHEIREVEGQKLTEEELTAQATACNLLNQYFAGQLAPDGWEKLKVEAIKRKNIRKKKSQDRAVGSVINCPICGGGKVRKDCPLCEGTTTIVVYPGINKGE